MIKTIIFDIGNVLMEFDSLAVMKDLLKEDKAIESVAKAIFRTGYWNELDLGREPEEVFRKMISEAPAYENEIRLTLANIDKCIGRADYAKSWIRDLKNRGYQILFLSNYSEFVMDSRWDVLDFLPLMDGGIFSCYVGMIKPDPAIFLKLFEKYDLEPSECVFIDDNAENIKAAENLGLNTIQFRGYPEAKEKLEELLSLCGDHSRFNHRETQKVTPLSC